MVFIYEEEELPTWKVGFDDIKANQLGDDFVLKSKGITLQLEPMDFFDFYSHFLEFLRKDHKSSIISTSGQSSFNFSALQFRYYFSNLVSFRILSN